MKELIFSFILGFVILYHGVLIAWLQLGFVVAFADVFADKDGVWLNKWMTPLVESVKKSYMVIAIGVISLYLVTHGPYIAYLTWLNVPNLVTSFWSGMVMAVIMLMVQRR